MEIALHFSFCLQCFSERSSACIKHCVINEIKFQLISIAEKEQTQISFDTAQEQTIEDERTFTSC